jgi:LL-diaminopimelate aminotransferase
MSRSPASRLSSIPPYPFAALEKRLAVLRAAGHDVIRLDMGSPDLPPPPQVVETLATTAQQAGMHGYGGFAGTPELRRAFADYYRRRFGVSLDPDTEVLALIGSKEGIAHMALAYLDPGDVALVPDPGYPAYEMGAILVGGESWPVRLAPELGFMPDLDSIPEDVLGRARILWINYPNNPTGAVAELPDLERIVEFCRKYNLLLCSDNPYSDLFFEDVLPPSALQVDGAKEMTVEFNSLSKTYNMAGWRVGVCVGRAEAVAALQTVKSNIDSGLFKVIDRAAQTALNEVPDSWIAERNAVYRERRDAIIEALPLVGLSAESPRAGLYVWAKVKGGDDAGYAEGALTEAHVSLTPGRVYGTAGEGYVRFSMVVTCERIEEAMERLVAWYAGRAG